MLEKSNLIIDAKKCDLFQIYTFAHFLLVYFYEPFRVTWIKWKKNMPGYMR